jgi:hypothetical protein
VPAALNIDRSVTGQPWRWRRSPNPSLGMEALVDELLHARGVEREDLARHRDPRIRDFLPDPSCFQDMDKGARRLADAIEGARVRGGTCITTESMIMRASSGTVRRFSAEHRRGEGGAA